MSELTDIIHKLGVDVSERDAEIARLKAELAEAIKDRDSWKRSSEDAHWRMILARRALAIGDSTPLGPIREEIESDELKSANADADLLGREVNAWRAAYKAWNDGDHHFREPFEAVANTDARPSAAARVKGGAA